MLTQEEETYLSKIDSTRVVQVYPFDPRGRELGDEIVAQIKSVLPQAEVLFMGSVALEIAGQKDIDIYILSEKSSFSDYLPELEKLFGKINKQGNYVKKSFIEWKMQKKAMKLKFS